MAMMGQFIGATTQYMLLCNNTVALGINKQHAVSTPDFFKIMALIGILLLS